MSGPFKLEVIRFGLPNERPPLLFVHGSYCGAWIWDKFFLPAFAEAGWWGAAISLRGHGKSEGVDHINSFGVADYLCDVAEGVKLFDQPPILIGHSLGGYLVQKFALEHPARGLVLLSSPSLMGLGGSGSHIALFYPRLGFELGKLMAYGPAHIDQDVIGEAFFSSAEAAKAMEAFLPLLQKESSRFSIEASWPDFRRPLNHPPAFVLGGDADAFVPTSDFRYEAFMWGAELKILRGVSHGVMLDSCWQAVAKEVMGWLEERFGKRR